METHIREWARVVCDMDQTQAEKWQPRQKPDIVRVKRANLKCVEV